MARWHERNDVFSTYGQCRVKRRRFRTSQKGSAPFISVLLLFSSMRYSPELHRSQSNEVTLRNVTFSSKGPPIFQKPLELDLHDTINALRRLFERRKSLSLSRSHKNAYHVMSTRRVPYTYQFCEAMVS